MIIQFLSIFILLFVVWPWWLYINIRVVLSAIEDSRNYYDQKKKVAK